MEWFRIGEQAQNPLKTDIKKTMFTNNRQALPPTHPNQSNPSWFITHSFKVYVNI